MRLGIRCIYAASIVSQAAIVVPTQYLEAQRIIVLLQPPVHVSLADDLPVGRTVLVNVVNGQHLGICDITTWVVAFEATISGEDFGLHFVVAVHQVLLALGTFLGICCRWTFAAIGAQTFGSTLHPLVGSCLGCLFQTAITEDMAGSDRPTIVQTGAFPLVLLVGFLRATIGIFEVILAHGPTRYGQLGAFRTDAELFFSLYQGFTLRLSVGGGCHQVFCQMFTA